MNVNRKELLSALKQAVRIVSKQRPNVRLRAAGGCLEVSATDLERFLSVSVSGSVDHFDLMIDAKDARDLVKNLSDDHIDIRPDGINAKIGGVILPGDDPTMMPCWPTFGETTGFSVDGARFKEMIKQVGFAAAREETQYAINGLMIHLENDQLKLIATDGCRLAFAVEQGIAGSCEAVVPGKAMNVLRAGLGKNDEMAVIVSEQMVQFEYGSTVLILRQLEYRFPDYTHVIPKSTEVDVRVNRKALEAAVRRVAVNCTKGAAVMQFGVNGALQLHLSASGNGEGHADVDAMVSTELDSASVGFNPKYVLDALKASDLDEVQLRFTDHSMPTIWDLGFTYVLMPISA